MFRIDEVPLLRRLVDSGIDDLHDLFEAASVAIEAHGDRRAQVQGSVFDKLIATLEFFHLAPTSTIEDVRKWPIENLKITAALIDIDVAAHLLRVEPDVLDRAVAMENPYKPWSWWRELGRAVKDGIRAKELAAHIGISDKTASKYIHLLTAAPPRDPRLAAFVALVRRGAFPPDAARIVGYHPSNARRLMAAERPLEYLEEQEVKSMARRHIDPKKRRTAHQVGLAYGVKL